MAKVLIVDDSSLGRKYLKRILLKADHEVVAEAENGEEGILLYKRIKPEIVTMDVDMPGMDGLETSKRILKDDPEARIIVISAHEENDLRAEMDKYGLKYCIIKPVTEENLKKAFQNALGPGTGKAKEIKAPGVKVSVSHYSMMNIFTAGKTGEEGGVVSLEIDKDTPFGFIEGDPIVLGLKSNGECLVFQCKIANTDTLNRSLKVEIINSYPLIIETAYQNLPTSMYADIRVISTRKRFPSIVKNFTSSEIIIESKADFNNDEKVNFDISDKNKLIPIDGKIISKTQGDKNAEYIIKLEFHDYNSKKTYVTYLLELASRMENSI